MHSSKVPVKIAFSMLEQLRGTLSNLLAGRIWIVNLLLLLEILLAGFALISNDLLFKSTIAIWYAIP